VNIKNILISQSQTDKAAYDALEIKYGVKVHFKPFITIKPVSMKTFRSQKINVLDYTAIIFTSKNAVDIFFQFCKELKIDMPAEMKYFCVNETTANYIQHHVQMRKRKVFVGKGNNQDLFPLFKKHHSEKYLYPCSEIRKSDIPDFMSENNIVCKELIIYETVSAELKDLNINDYQVIAFFSPSGIASLKENFPDYKQNETLFAAFGSTTAKAILDTNFRVDIQAPIPQIPSMVGAIELKLKELSDPKAFKKYVKQLEQKMEQQLEEERKMKEEQEKEKLLKQKQKQLKKEANKKHKKTIEIVTEIKEKPVTSINTKKTVPKTKSEKTSSDKKTEKVAVQPKTTGTNIKTKKSTPSKNAKSTKNKSTKTTETKKTVSKNKTTNNTTKTTPSQTTQKTTVTKPANVAKTTTKKSKAIEDTPKNTPSKKTIKTSVNNNTNTSIVRNSKNKSSVKTSQVKPTAKNTVSKEKTPSKTNKKK